MRDRGIGLSHTLEGEGVEQLALGPPEERLVGTGVGFGAGLFFAYSLSQLDGGDVEAGDLLLGGVIFAPIGAFLGSIVGESFYSWTPVYQAP